MKTPEQMAEEYANDWHKDCDYPPEILRHTKKATANVFLAGYQAAKDSAARDTDGIDTGTKMQWISVKDRLPEIDQWCSWWDISGATEPCTAFRSVNDIETWWENYTHWMPLPKPPEDK